MRTIPAIGVCALHLLAAMLTAQCTGNTPAVPTGTISSGTVCYSNNTTLPASGVTINGSAGVTFVAGQSVHLAPEFRATAGTAPTTLHAWVETVPSVISVSPANGSGMTQSFTWTVSSPSGYANLSDVYAFFNAPANPTNMCYIRYNRASNLLSVVDNSQTWSPGITPGSSATTGNFSPNCTVNGIGSSVNGSGTQLTVTASVTFQSTFSGAKDHYAVAYDNQGLNTVWQPYGSWTVPAPPPGFTVALSAIVSSVVAGAPASYNVTVLPINGFAGTITFAASGLPGGAAATFNPSSITGSGSTTMTVNTAPGGVTGNFSVLVTGICGSLQRTSTAASLVVQDFTLSLSPASQTVAPNGSGTLTVAAGSVNGYNQPVTLFYTLIGTAGYNPPGTLAPGVPQSFSINPTTGGYITVQIRGFSGGVNHYTSADVLVSSTGDFSLTPVTSSQTIAPSGSANYAIAVTSANNFTGPVDLTVAGLPPGVSASFTPPRVTPNATTTLTVSAGAGAVAGTYPLTITGWNVAVQRTQTVWLVIAAAADFTLTSAQTSQTVAPSGAAGYSILVSTSAGFSGAVGMTASGLPPGATAVFSPTSVSGSGSSSLAITTASTTPLGNFPITITGQSGSKSHTTLVFLTVTAAAPATMVSPVTGSTLSSSSATFLWNPGLGAAQNQLIVGSLPGGSDYYSATLGSGANAYCLDGTFRCQSASLSNIPVGGQALNVYARLSSFVSGTWQHTDYAYQTGPAAGGPAPRTASSQISVVNDGNESQAYTTYLCHPDFPGSCVPYYCDSYNDFGQCVHYTYFDGGRVGGPCRSTNSSGQSDSSVSVKVSAGRTDGKNSYAVKLTAGPSARSGSWAFACQYDQQYMGSVAFTVYDATPHIDSVVQDPPEETGGPFYIVIYGRNFGTKGVGSAVYVCAPGTYPCTSTNRTPDINVDRDAFYSFWQHSDQPNSDAVKVLLTPSSNASGPYVVQLTTSGAAGSGFLAGQGSSSQSDNQGQVTVTPVPRNLVVTARAASASTAQTLNSGNTIYVDPTPAMPILTVTIGNARPGDTMTLRYVAEFTQVMPPSFPSDSNPCTLQVQSTTYPVGPLAEQSAAEVTTWNSLPVFGNRGSIKWSINGVQQPDFTFNILGQNPDWNTAQSALQGVTFNGTPVWFVPNVAIHETFGQQFWRPGIADSTNWCWTRSDGPRLTVPRINSPQQTGMPVYGYPGGYGILQLDPPVSASDAWDWRRNIASWQSRFSAQAGPEIDTQATQPVDPRAYPFWIRQVDQWQKFNAQRLAGEPEVPWPGDPGPNVSPNCAFQAPSPTAFPPVRNTGTPNTYWYGDAILMKQISGAPNGNYVSWQNSDPQHPFWKFSKSNSVSKDMVYEFCTCTLPNGSNCDRNPK